ncbi:DNA repair protein RecN (Recombination protein N) [Rhizomicrobium palustre]|uniref:DNA repair protein RecN n=1 Tax=Rhizomicrobium palustre TaxID=189966 RepID=A0A846MVT5_9PROT|nr:DNA repair protein RecN [Rhizomicrobium palustre]NIK87486.1 DNA repair protein RecN (Recombination protein N) [Rhizomicrobium palustre]
MLAALSVRDIVLIEAASLEFAPGLNVLTGETGAGKSILLDALGMATGGRGRAAVRPGAAQGSATALFDPPAKHSARMLLAEQSIPAEGEIVLRRTLSSEGRTRGFVNDEPVGVGLLKDLGSALLEVHGQSDDRGLFDSATHRALLDAFGGHEALVAEVAKQFAAYDTARIAAEELKRLQATAMADAEYVKQAVDELSALDAEEGEEEALAAERALLMNAARIAEDVSAASDLLSGERGAEAGLAGALKKLSRMGEEARKAAAAAEAALEQAYAMAEEGRRELDALLSRLEVDSSALERKEERLFALRAAARKYSVKCDGLPGVLDAFRKKLDALDLGGGKLKQLEAEAAAALVAFNTAAKKLSAARKTAAADLEKAVAAELTPLKLGHARFRVSFVASEPSAQGLERVAFEVATVEGAAYGSLAKIASGGELARFSLAIKVVLAQAAPPAALVFDEVDRGVGGAVADAVGLRLQKLSQSTQVLLVTHSPQVAARADRHFRIKRKGDKTVVEQLEDDERLEEVARMLSGAAVTEEARAAAKRLISEAQAVPKKPRKRA